METQGREDFEMCAQKLRIGRKVGPKLLVGHSVAHDVERNLEDLMPHGHDRLLVPPIAATPRELSVGTSGNLRRSGFTSRSRKLPDSHTGGNRGTFSEQIALLPSGPLCSVWWSAGETGLQT